jgi:hypothetical protein
MHHLQRYERLVTRHPSGCRQALFFRNDNTAIIRVNAAASSKLVLACPPAFALVLPIHGMKVDIDCVAANTSHGRPSSVP